MRRYAAALVAVTFVLAGCGSAPPRPETSASSDDTASSALRAVLSGRAAHTATLLRDGTALVTGGCDTDGCTDATASTVVLASSGPRAADDLHDARDAHTATLLADGSVLVVGGFAAEGRPPLTSAERYDGGSRHWSLVAELRIGRGGHAAARLGDGRVVVAGGWVGSRTYTASTEIFDPVAQRFGAGPDLPSAADGLAAVALRDGSVLVTGGQIAPGVATPTAVVIDPDGSAHAVGPMREARFKHTLVALPSGRVLVIGGTSDDRTLLASTEIYDPATRVFAAGPALVAGRYKLSGSAALLPDGRVVVAGGGPGIELIDPAAAVSTVVAGVAEGRTSFSTVSVVGTDVRVIGGYDDRIALTRTDLTIPLTSLR